MTELFLLVVVVLSSFITFSLSFVVVVCFLMALLYWIGSITTMKMIWLWNTRLQMEVSRQFYHEAPMAFDHHLSWSTSFILQQIHQCPSLFIFQVNSRRQSLRAFSATPNIFSTLHLMYRRTMHRATSLHHIQCTVAHYITHLLYTACDVPQHIALHEFPIMIYAVLHLT